MRWVAAWDGTHPRGASVTARGSPTLDLLVVFLLVFLAQQALGILGVGLTAVALAAPLATAPWTLATSVYAHVNLGHLVANAIGLAVIGFLLERTTTRARFHAYVLLTGATAGVTEVTVGWLLGTPVIVLGASGAVLALYGYAVTGNPVTAAVLDRLGLSRRAQLAVFITVALMVTIATARPGIALTAHFTGFLLGLIAGRYRLLRPARPR